MRLNFDKIFAAGTAAVFTALLAIAPASFTFAANLNTQSGSVLGMTLSLNFCTNLANNKSALIQTIATQQSQLGTGHSQRLAGLGQNRSERHAELQQSRSAADAAFAKSISILQAMAVTSGQQQAAAAYQATVQKAVTVRRAAVDTAIKTHHDSVDAALQSHVSEVDSALASLKQNLTGSITSAQVACSNGTNQSVIRLGFANSLNSIHSQFETSITDNSFPVQLKALDQSESSAVQQALHNFINTVDAARTTLKIAFGVK